MPDHNIDGLVLQCQAPAVAQLRLNWPRFAVCRLSHSAVVTCDSGADGPGVAGCVHSLGAKLSAADLYEIQSILVGVDSVNE